MYFPLVEILIIRLRILSGRNPHHAVLVEFLGWQLHRLIHPDAAVLGAEFLYLLIEVGFFAAGQDQRHQSGEEQGYAGFHAGILHIELVPTSVSPYCSD